MFLSYMFLIYCLEGFISTSKFPPKKFQDYAKKLDTVNSKVVGLEDELSRSKDRNQNLQLENQKANEELKR